MQSQNEHYTIGGITKKVEKSSTDFELTNTELKRKYILWNIETFNILASQVKSRVGTFGTGYPFYALDSNLKGTLPIIREQIRYNRELLKVGEELNTSRWLCAQCLKKNYANMPDLKIICKPCQKMHGQVKPRKIINRLPDIDMWLVCEDGCVHEAGEELGELLRKYNMRTSDFNPIESIEDVKFISEELKEGRVPEIFIPIDAHIIEYSKLMSLIREVPIEIRKSYETGEKPYIPIQPISYRKVWQYDEEAYNFIYDFLSAFTTFDFPKQLQQAVDTSRGQISHKYTKEQLYKFLLQSATEANFRRFKSPELRSIFEDKLGVWRENYNPYFGDFDDVAM